MTVVGGGLASAGLASAGLGSSSAGLMREREGRDLVFYKKKTFLIFFYYLSLVFNLIRFN